MKNLSFGIVALSALAGLLLVEGASRGGGQAPKIRQPAVAGTFYPADPKELAGMIDGFLEKAAPPPLENVVALVAPHAGYVYSGPVAAYSYALLKGRKFDRVVVIAPSHYEAFGFSSVYDGAAYTTPFGQVPVDQAFAQKLAKASPLIKLSSAGHAVSADHLEHSIEVQLPFLQRVLGQFQLVPVIVGDQSYDACRALGVALAKLVAGTNTLIVASSDLSHYHTYDQAVAEDHKTLNAIAEYDYFDLARNLDSRVWEACGGGPIVATMIAAERLGATEAKVLHYANTGDVTGDHSRVVGYGAVALVKAAGTVKAAASAKDAAAAKTAGAGKTAGTAKDAAPAKDEGAGRIEATAKDAASAKTAGAAKTATSAKAAEAPFSLSAREKDALLKIARASVETSVRTGKPYACTTGGLETLAQERGAFVTLTKNGQLRGCIGYVAPLKPLYLAVRDVAQMAALRDTRFRPVTASELADLQYEISVLSPLRHVTDVQEIRLGQDGLLIHTSDHEGLFLPQVATEEHWDRATLLEQVCYKAGLPARAWQSPDADLFRFTAVVFGEHRPVEAWTLPARPWLPAPGSPSPPAARF